MVLPFGVCECIIVPDVSDKRVSTLSDKVLDSAKVTSRGGDSESSPAVIVICVHLDSLKDNFLDNDNLALFCCVEEAILVICNDHLGQLIEGALLSTLLSPVS